MPTFTDSVGLYRTSSFFDDASTEYACIAPGHTPWLGRVVGLVGDGSWWMLDGRKCELPATSYSQ